MGSRRTQAAPQKLRGAFFLRRLLSCICISKVPFSLLSLSGWNAAMILRCAARKGDFGGGELSVTFWRRNLSHRSMPEYERSLNTFIYFFCLYSHVGNGQPVEGYKCSLACTHVCASFTLQSGRREKKKKVCQEPRTENIELKYKQRCSVPDDSFQDHFCLPLCYRQ